MFHRNSFNEMNNKYLFANHNTGKKEQKTLMKTKNQYVLTLHIGEDMMGFEPMTNKYLKECCIRLPHTIPKKNE